MRCILWIELSYVFHNTIAFAYNQIILLIFS